MRLRPLAFPTLLLAACCALAAQPASPTAWADPTRPAGPAATPAEPGAARAVPVARAASAPPPAAPQLQSVQLGTNGQASALVNGRLVQAGDTLGATRIVAIDADGLTLRDAKGRTERLNLISAAIAKQAGGPERPVAASPVSTTAAAGPTATLGREGQRQ